MGAITIPIWLLLTLLGGSAGLAVGGRAIPLKVGHSVKVGAKKVGGVFHKCKPKVKIIVVPVPATTPTSTYQSCTTGSPDVAIGTEHITGTSPFRK